MIPENVVPTTSEEPRGSIPLPEALDAYQRVYMASRNFAAKTRRSYADDLAGLVAFLDLRHCARVGQVSLTDLELYLANLDQKGLAGSSRRRKTYAIKSFFRFLGHSGYLPKDISLELVPPQTGQREPRVLSKQEYEALLRVCSHHTRDAAVIELLLQTGIRLSEIAHLRRDDIQLPRRIGRDPDAVGRLHILGKGRKDRWIPLNYKACQALKAWLDARGEDDREALFVTKFGKPIGPRAIEYLVQKYMQEAGIRGASVHALRHTFATHHVAQGTSLRTVQEVLGHADLKTTSIYVQLAQEAVKRELQDHAL